MHESAKVEAGSTEPRVTAVVSRRTQLRRAPLAGRRAVIVGGMLWVAAASSVGAAAFTFEQLFTHSKVARPSDVWLPPSDEQWADAVVVPTTAGATVDALVAAGDTTPQTVAVMPEPQDAEAGTSPQSTPPRPRTAPRGVESGARAPEPPPSALVVPIHDPDAPVLGTSTTVEPTSTIAAGSGDGRSDTGSGSGSGATSSSVGSTAAPTTTRPTSSTSTDADDGDRGDNSGPGSGDDPADDSGSNSGPGKGGDGRHP